MTALTHGELHELADKGLTVHGEFGPVFRAMILFAGYVGLRSGEMFALEESDVGRDEVATRQNLDGTGTLKLPKNDQERVVVLPPARDALGAVPARLDLPWLLVTPGGRQFGKGSLHYYGNPVRAAFGRPGMDFYELRHFCATHCSSWVSLMRTLRCSSDTRMGAALVMSTYGHPSEDVARERLKRAYAQTVTPLRVAEGGSQKGRKAV